MDFDLIGLITTAITLFIAPFLSSAIMSVYNRGWLRNAVNWIKRTVVTVQSGAFGAILTQLWQMVATDGTSVTEASIKSAIVGLLTAIVYAIGKKEAK